MKQRCMRDGERLLGAVAEGLLANIGGIYGKTV